MEPIPHSRETAPEQSLSDQERHNRQLIELLGELRVAIPGVQVLFAFLLVVPFSARFDTITDFQRDLYFTALLCSTIATVLLIAPSSFHRLRFKRHDKRRLIYLASKLLIAGLTFIALAMTAVVMLITDYLFGTAMTVVVTGGTVLLFAWFWFGLAFKRGLEEHKLDRSASQETLRDGE